MPLLFFFLIFLRCLRTTGIGRGAHCQLLLILNQIPSIGYAKCANNRGYPVAIGIVPDSLPVLVDIAAGIGVGTARCRFLSRCLLLCSLCLLHLDIGNLLARDGPTTAHALPRGLLLWLRRAPSVLPGTTTAETVVISDLALVVLDAATLDTAVIFEAARSTRINIHIETTFI